MFFLVKYKKIKEREGIYMSKKGENIYKRKDGRWEARGIKGYDAQGRVRYVYCYGRTYREAKDKLSRVRAALTDAKSEKSGKKRFFSYCDEWLFINRARLKESTYVKYETALEKHIKPILGGYPASSLSSALISRFGQELVSDKGLCPKTARDILALLHAVLEYAGTQEPEMKAIKVIYPKESGGTMRVLSANEQKKLTSYLLTDMDECKLGILLALFTGMRIGELCALRWRDISISERTLTISSTMQRLKDYSKDAPKKTKIVICEPKSRSSARVIPLTESVTQLCTKWKREPDDFVLTGEGGRYMEPRALQYRLKKYALECGLEGVHFHSLRHTFATRCVEVGFEIKSLSEILGHTSLKFTLERYVHSSIELKRRNMDKLSLIGC